MNRSRRKIKLIKPSLQLKLTAIFVAISALSLLLQAVLFMNSITRVALDLPHDGFAMMNQTGGLLRDVMLTSFLVFLPLTFAVGVLSTFRIAGPIYRFEMFLNQVRRGEKPADCSLRKGDNLQDFCQLLNEVTAPLRSGAVAVEPPNSPRPSEAEDEAEQSVESAA
jgi:hypothetical protein